MCKGKIRKEGITHVLHLPFGEKRYAYASLGNGGVSRERSDYDVIVIGSGIGGLVAATQLAVKGAKVLVLEKYVIPGGSSGYYERDGYTFDVGSSVMIGFSDKVVCIFWHDFEDSISVLGVGWLFAEGKLAAVGCEMEVIPDPTTVHFHLPNNLSVKVPKEYSDFISELTAKFPHEKEGILKFYGECWKIFNALNSLELKSLEEPIYLLGQFFQKPLECLTLVYVIGILEGSNYQLVGFLVAIRKSLSKRSDDAGQVLPPDTDCHHFVLEIKRRPYGSIFLAFPTVLDSSLAPEGRHILHIFTTSSIEGWEGLSTEDYEAKKKVVAYEIISRLEKKLFSGAQIINYFHGGGSSFKFLTFQVSVGSPKTHRRYLARDKGSYGPMPRSTPKGLLGMPFNTTACKMVFTVSAIAAFQDRVL
uniref:Prolycopene isomerase, chloroplastic-like n=1 Tax=Populus alba TaxID=43335 RepID=A0A4U5MPB9_POPAL|nr:prolycopene isomerase, chloroplastic-like [Populus alba]